MSLRQLISDTDLAWDGGWQHFPRGTLVEVEPGSVLEVVYGGPDNLVDLGDGAPAAAARAGVSN
jgi:hypothetical protein